METELKLRIPPSAVERIARDPLLNGDGSETVQQLVATYYDTAEFDLVRKGATLRVRREGDQWIQTVKWAGEAKAGLHERNELEIVVPGPTPDCSLISHPELDALFRPLQGSGALKPVFETSVTRSTRMVNMGARAAVEASIDRGEIRAGGRSFAISEVELELKHGSVPALFELALELAAKAPVHLENRSKAERGYALARGEVETPQKAAPPVLGSAMSVSEAFAAIAWSTLQHMQANEQGVIAGKDAEFLHQMRVGLRRLRSAFSAFSGALPQAARDPIARELRWLAGALGPARDWDVFMAETLPPVRRAFGGAAPLAALADEGARLQLAARRAMTRAVRSRRYQRMLIGLASWLTTQAWRKDASPDLIAVLETPVRGYAQGELETRYERVRKRGRRLGQSTAAELHELRIAIKKLRYSIDFFASLFDTDAARRLRSRLARLQDILGTMNDASTMQRLLTESFGAKRAAAAAEARGILIGWSGGRAHALRTELDRAWKSFRRTETFW